MQELIGIKILLFFIGFSFLIKGSDFIINGATSIAKRLNISTWIIGIAIVGFGTSIPEFMVALLGNLKGAPNIGLGTIIGSNIFNLLFIIGVSAIIAPLALKKEWVWRDMPINVLSVIISVLFLEFAFFDGGDEPEILSISRSEGFILLLFFLLWLYWLYAAERKKAKLPSEGTSIEVIPLNRSFFMILVGGVAVFLGGDWVVEGGKVLAEMLDLSRSFIGLVVVGLGTSIPELAVSVRAAIKKDSGIAVGNIIGSNIFDFLFILGSVAMIEPLVFVRELGVDAVITFAASVFVIIASLWRRRFRIDRFSGWIMVGLYLVYLSYLLYRG